MRQAKPLVSILILTWNRREDVARSIDSALCQTYREIEVIVVDNGSTDGTADAVERDYPGVRMIRLASNVGCPSGRNVGFSHCTGAYIYQLDDDGWLERDAIEVAVARAESDPAIGVVMSRIHETDNASIVRCRPVGIERAAFLGGFSGGCSMLRREAMNKAGCYPDDFFRQGEEGDLALRLYESGYLIVLEPASIMYHRPSAVGRSTRTFLYYTLRNTNKTGLRLWPFPWCVLRPLVNMGHSLRGMLALRYWSLPFAILRELFRDVLSLRRTRRPVSLRTFRLLRGLQRRPSATISVMDGSVHELPPIAGLLETGRSGSVAHAAPLHADARMRPGA